MSRRTFSVASKLQWIVIGIVCLGILAPTASGQATRALTFQDLMKFNAIQRPVMADDGSLIAYGAQPDRGDGEGVVHRLADGEVFRIPRGSAPVIADSGRFVAMVVKPSFDETERAGKTPPKPGMALLDTRTGAVTSVARVERFAFSSDSTWLAYALSAAAADKADPSKSAEGGNDTKKAVRGTPLKLRQLESGSETELPDVMSFVFDRAAKFLAYVVAADGGTGNGLFIKDLANPAAPPVVVNQADRARYDQLTWTRTGSLLAFVAAADDDGPGTVWTWDGSSRAARQVVVPAQAPAGWVVPLKNELAWSRDGQRLFFGFRPASPKPAVPPKKEGPADPFDTGAILAKAEVDVWHWNDPRINSQQKKSWAREKDRTYRAVVHMGDGRVVRLADLDVPDVEVPENARVALCFSDVPYRTQTTWGERQRDVYLVSLADGARTRVTSGLIGNASLAPDGRSVVYFRQGQWHLYDAASASTRDVTSALGVRLDDEQHDTPDTAPAYGLGGWLADGSALLVYDRFDIWQLPVKAGTALNVTGGEGLRQRIRFRIVGLDADAPGFAANEALLLSANHEREKNDGFYSATVGRSGVVARLDEPRRLRFVAKAEKADTVMYTREQASEFPDLWAADLAFRQPRKVTNANPQVGEFAWGSPELVEWRSLDGLPLQGVLIKPANYKPGTRYPTIVYFYERMADRLFEFNEPVVNHRPSFGVYASAGYAVFLPDVVFDIGRPGYSATKCLVPGVQKLIDMGIADPKAIGLHGHSWSGYETAFVITQTNIFAAAVAGAPVANMTSAYGGIRWESGVARQFQYEKTQSRIGGSLWEYPERFIENSPLFFADRIQTPLLLMHGDEDGAVPWYQSIEMYLAMRRFGKDCIFLQYRGEPHHPQKYPNKLDYSIRMKQYFDHYLKGEPAADWITSGVAYTGR